MTPTQEILRELEILKLAAEQLRDRIMSVFPMKLRIGKEDVDPLLAQISALEKALQ